MNKKQKGWPPANMKPECITTNAYGANTLEEASQVGDDRYVYNPKTQTFDHSKTGLSTGRGSIKKSK